MKLDFTLLTWDDLLISIDGSNLQPYNLFPAGTSALVMHRTLTFNIEDLPFLLSGMRNEMLQASELRDQLKEEPLQTTRYENAEFVVATCKQQYEAVKTFSERVKVFSAEDLQKIRDQLCVVS